MLPDKDDKDFWRTVVCDVKPIKFEEDILHVKIPKVRLSEHRFFAIEQDFSTYSKSLDDIKPRDIDKKTLRKFKREEFAVEDVLDLHGKTEDMAFAAVDDFIPRCYAKGNRCVIIITGKGLRVHADEDVFDDKGVLKKAVPQWLNAPRLRAMILNYKHPSERLGGAGAIYILLRRNRNK